MSDKKPTAKQPQGQILATTSWPRPVEAGFHSHLAAIQQSSQGASSHPVHWLACWDFDGTLLDGDITEGLRGSEGEEIYMGLMAWSIRQGFLANSSLTSYTGEAGVIAFWHDYRTLLAQDDLQAYLYIADLLAAIPLATQEALLTALAPLIPTYYQPYLLHETFSLMGQLARHGVEQYVISASPHLFVRELGSILPLSRQQIFGIDRNRQGEHYRDSIVNHGEGKAERLRAVLATCRKERVNDEVGLLLGVGNNWQSDGPMLQEACRSGGVGLMINPPLPPPTWASAFPIYTLTTQRRVASL